jgi:hypothetical protein
MDYELFDSNMYLATKWYYNGQFRGIVSNFNTIEAASDQRLRHCVGWILGDAGDLQADDIADVFATIAEERHLDPDQMHEAYELCLAKALAKDVQHGEA